jgi:nucleotide-binding universal stress UspA family protein
VIAWNGSAECANAVRSTIGLLKMASGVRVVRFTENKELRLSDERLLEYLSRHDVHAEMDTHLPRTDIASDLLEYASRAGAEYIVMGGYSHSRAGEFLFGGVTRELLGSCPISLVMAH